MIRSSFWKIGPNIFFGKTFKISRRIFFAFLKLEKKFGNLAIGLSICEVPAQSIQKKMLLTSQKRDRFPVGQGPGRAVPGRTSVKVAGFFYEIARKR